MRIPRKQRKKIINQKKFVIKINEYKYIHYRDLHKNIDSTNFQICTKVDFKAINKKKNQKDIWETWDVLKNNINITYEHTSKTGSQYLIDDKDNVYRFSDHWGAVASCEWTREGKGQLMMSIFESGAWEIGVANLKDFQIFRRSVDRNVDMILNPKWIEKMKTIMLTRKKLYELKSIPEYKNMSLRDKKFIGQHFGFFNKQLSCIK